jgi:toluene monooxygenase electron transfer component
MRIRINARNRGFQYEAMPGQAVLYAGLAAGIDLPYECATGTCGTCKAKLVEGSLRDAWPEAPGRKYVKPAQGEYLMCQCAAEGDVTLEVAKFVKPTEPGAARVAAASGRLRDPALLVHDVMAFDVELDEPRDFEAGQFMVLAAPGVQGFRAYSMVNYERAAKRLKFVAKKKPGGGFSEWLFGSAREGAQLHAFGPLGKATFQPGIANDLVCIAGGSGIAGMMSILQCAADDGYFEGHRGWVFFGVRKLSDAFFLEELSAFRARAPQRLAITVALSDEAVPAEAAGRWPQLAFEQGFVHEVAGRALKGRYQNIRAYVAGPPPAVDAALRLLLLEGKLTADNIRYDKFS